MRTRTSLTTVLSTVVALFAMVIIALVACAGPDASAEGPPAVPTTASAGTPATSAGQHRVVHRGTPPKHQGTAPKQAQPKQAQPKQAQPKRTHTSAPASRKSNPVPPRMGNASVPDGSMFRMAKDGLTFTMVYSTLEAKTDRNARSRTLSTTVPITGDTRNASLLFTVSGYAFAESAAARLTTTACGHQVRRTFRSGTDDDYLQDVTVALRGAHRCTITITVEAVPDQQVRDSAAIIDVLALDGRIESRQ